MSSSGPYDAGFRAWSIARSIDFARWQATEASLLVESANDRHSRHLATMQGLLLDIEAAATRLMATWERIRAVADKDPGLIDPPQDGVSVIRSHGPNRALVEAMNAICAEDNGIAEVGELFEQVRRLAEDDNGPGAR